MRAKLSRPTFTQWVAFALAHPPLDAAVQKVADFIAVDRGCWPGRANTFSYFLLHLRVRHPSHPQAPTREEFERAWDAFQGFLEGGGMIPVRRGVPRRAPDHSRSSRGYNVLETTAARIRQLAKRLGITQGEVVDRAVDLLDTQASQN